MSFLRDMYLLDADFFRFVWGLLQQPEAAGPATATLAAHAGTKVAVEMVAHARASSCVAPWCKRLSQLARAHQHAADNVLALLAVGRRNDSNAGYLRELLVSCPRASTRLAFEHLAVDAVEASSNPPPPPPPYDDDDDDDNAPPESGGATSAIVSLEGEDEQQPPEAVAPASVAVVDQQTSALSRVLLDLLADESYGSARGASLGGLAHVAAVAAAAAANHSQRAVLIAGRAVPRLLDCLRARHSHELAMAGASASAATAAGNAGAAAAAAAAPAKT
ncbi:unnamed protein product, partial [Ectocarpus sp. 8 AP-2014]